MAKRRASRKMSRKSARMSRRQARKSHRRRTMRKRGGQHLSGAPVQYSLAGNWSSRMSLGQGDDYFKYHEGQHGGELGAYPAAVMSPGLPADLRGPAMIAGIDKAVADVAPLRDDANPNAVAAPVAKGGARRRRNGGKRTRKALRKKRGGALGFAPANAPGMLLPNSAAYTQAGLNPEYRGTAVEYDVARVRDAAY